MILLIIYSKQRLRQVRSHDYRRSSQDPRYESERPARMGANKQGLSVCSDYEGSERQRQAQYVQGGCRQAEALERGEDMILYVELGIVLMMLGVTVFELIRAVIWEIQEIIEDCREEVDDDVER